MDFECIYFFSFKMTVVIFLMIVTTSRFDCVKITTRIIVQSNCSELLFLYQRVIIHKYEELQLLNFKSNVFSYLSYDTFKIVLRGGSRTAGTTKMERFGITVNGWKPLTIITKRSILDAAAALDPPLVLPTFSEFFNRRFYIVNRFSGFFYFQPWI